MSMEVFVLGTSGMMPLPGRFLTSAMIRRNGELFLFDCGEGTQVSLKMLNLHWKKINSIFISHMHADHVTGLPGLLMLSSQVDRDDPLYIYGPEKIREYVENTKHMLDMYINYQIKYVAVEPGIIWDTDEFSVEAVPLMHTKPCFGYVFREKNRPGEFSVENAKNLNIPCGPLWGRLQKGEDVILEDGTVVHPEQVLGAERHGSSFAYITDTQYLSYISKHVKDVDLLLCEGMFTQDLSQDAFEKKHMTCTQAAKIALDANVKKLGKKILWIFDSNTYRMAKPLPKASILLEASEYAKSLKSVDKIIEKACLENMSRDDIFIAMGGGAVLDTAAFTASIFKRGCSLILIPTTLLAMTDASVGGKTGINFENCKNCIGTFYPANSVILCTDFLQSLSENAFLNGLGEIIKMAFLSSDEDLLKQLVINKTAILQRDVTVLRQIIKLAVGIKCTFVEKDPFDSNGTRRALNLGHTFGHALESLRRMNVSHGQAVAWGLAKSILAAEILNICSKEFAQSVIRLLKGYGFDVDYKINFGEWFEYRKYLYKDKKIQNNELKFVLLKQQGQVAETALDERLIKKLVVEGPEVPDVLL